MDEYVSIHAPLRGATHGIRSGGSGIRVFQSTHPCGVRLEEMVENGAGHYVSIHAPLRGATGRSTRANYQLFKFQSTHPCGVRHIACFTKNAKRRFQSTHPCGVRRCRYDHHIGSDQRRFQSTHPCGVRLKPSRKDISDTMFQSTHPCGVRHGVHIIVAVEPEVSIHAPLRGATLAIT